MTVEDVWYGEDWAAKLARASLWIPSRAFAALVSLRGSLYDRGVLKTKRSEIPVISVGNLTVGGTGKTPFTAELVRRLSQRGVRTAIVMRGYGGDEVLLHERLNANVRVFAGADRVASIRDAARAGIDAVVMDDGFQHRRAARDADIVLVSAERWRDSARMLPAGSYREPPSALSRATVVVVTVKSAADGDARAVAAAVGQVAPSAPVVIARLRMSAVRAWRDARELPLSELAGADVLAVSAIGDPASFESALRSAGAVVTSSRWRDHHPFSRLETTALAARAAGHKYVICTEKDVVKLGPLWPSQAGGLWYVSQAVEVIEGESFIDAAIELALSKRQIEPLTS